jgi:hypothetical protein
MEKKLKKIILLFAISISMMSCSSDSESSSTDSVDYVKDAASLMRNMKLDGATIKTGDVPVPTGELTDVIASMPRTVVVTSNSLFGIPIQTTTTEGRIPRIVFIKLEGSDKYYQIDIDENGIPVASNRSSNNPPPRIPLSCTGGPNVRLEANGFQETPSYSNVAEVYTFSPPVQAAPADFGSFFTNRNLWSKKSITFKALDVGTGDVQVSLTWDTETDVDLWLTEPNNNKIYYGNKNSSTGGALDFDNTSGYGPENIFYQNTAPSGTYKVEVNYFSRRNVTTGTNYNVVVKNGSQITSYDGTLTASSQVNLVTTFIK